MYKTYQLFLISSLFVFSIQLSAQNKVGRKVSQTSKPEEVQVKTPQEAAGEYFKEDAQNNRGGGDKLRYLSLHYGTYTSSVSYKWAGNEKLEGLALRTYGVTYRVGEWINSMDLLIRIDFNDFEIEDQYLQKLSFMPVVAFPDSASGFPLYFGAGLGAGVFFRQIEKESSLSLDYQLLVGARFLDVYNGAGFFLETGLKNHLHLLSDGQLNGTFLSGGAVFEF